MQVIVSGVREIWYAFITNRGDGRCLRARSGVVAAAGEAARRRDRGEAGGEAVGVGRALAQGALAGGGQLP